MVISIVKRIWANLIPILLTFFFIMVLGNFIEYWNDPVWGFSQFGIGVVFTAFFLLAWVIIFYACKIIARKREAKTIETGGSAAAVQHAEE